MGNGHEGEEEKASDRSDGDQVGENEAGDDLKIGL